MRADSNQSNRPRRIYLAAVSTDDGLVTVVGEYDNRMAAEDAAIEAADRTNLTACVGSKWSDSEAVLGRDDFYTL